MDRVAIISDIHGNITALNAVLEDIRKRGINKIYCLGDMIIKCSSPFECVEKIFENCEVIIKGNCELRAVEDPRIEEHIWNRDKLTLEQREKIKKLPLYYDFKMSGYNIRLIHASPRAVTERSYFWDLDDEFTSRIKLMFENTEYLNNIGSDLPDILIFGHIHKPILLRLKDKTLINPGAVSNTSDVITKNGKQYTYGSYLILEGNLSSDKLDRISYKIVKFVYDNIEEAQKIMETDMPNKEEAYTEIATGKYFDRKILEKKKGNN